MVAEHLLVIAPSDLRAVRLTCQSCRAVVSLQLNETVQVPKMCPSCRGEWDTEKSGSINSLVRGVKGLAQADKMAGFDVAFEMADPSRP